MVLYPLFYSFFKNLSKTTDKTITGPQFHVRRGCFYIDNGITN